MPLKKETGADLPQLFWPAMIAAETGVAMARQFFGAFSGPAAEPEPPPPEPHWASENEIVLELGAVRLRFFGAGTAYRRNPILVCTPFALHDARVADLCEGHSLMAVLRKGGAPLYLVEWLSATETQASRGIDDYLADLNILVDEIAARNGAPCDFIGLCQGGWLSLIYAARYPAKAGRLVLTAAPIDLGAGASPLSTLAQSTPIEAFQELVRLGGGLARGAQAMQFWRIELENPEKIHDLLQCDLPLDSPVFLAREALFRAWSEHTVDLPGAYYLEVVEKFYKRNELAEGQFVALGKRILLSEMRRPLYLIAALDDDVAAPEQTLACARLVGTPQAAQRQKTAPGGHINLFVGAESLKNVWPDVLEWLAAPLAGE